MKLNLLAFSLLFFLSLAFAEAYSGSYQQDWAKITRSVDVSGSICPNGVAGVCPNTGASSPAGTYLTQVTITVENTGSIERNQAQLTESLRHVPAGARLSFDASPIDSDGISATFALGSIRPGEKKSVSYSIAARISEKEALSLPAPIISAITPLARLDATELSSVGSRVSLSLFSPLNKPIASAYIRAGFPDGSSREYRTDEEGRASFIAEKEGFYTYSVKGYALERLVSTSVQPERMEEAPLPSGAALVDPGLFSGLSGLLPILAAIFGLAVLALLIYNFFVSRDEGEEEPEKPAKVEQYYSRQPEPAAPVYSQSITFGKSEPVTKEDGMQDATRNLVESRKKKMQAAEVSANPPEHNHLEAGQSMSIQGRDIEKEVKMERELEKLEEETGPDSEEDQEEIEKAIAELEEIRKKLRERREQVLSVEREIQSELEKEEEPERPAKPQPRVMPPKERQQPKVTPSSFGKRK